MFGGKKTPKPAELIKSCKEAVAALEKSKDPKTVEKASEELGKSLAGMKLILCGDAEHEPNPDASVQLGNDIFQSDILPTLLTANILTKMDHEAKKDTSLIFSNLLRRQVGSRSPTVEHICRNPAILESMVTGYETMEISLTCGSMLRECVRHESLTKIVLTSPTFWNFFKYIEFANFDVASDAFSSMKDVLTKHKAIVAEFLEKNYDQFFEMYTNLLNSPNYVSKRQSLKLLGELLLDRANFNIMTKYISDQNNLKLLMILLRDKSRNIQFEAFHVFKVFVANPNKPQPILHILSKNKEKLIAYLNNFHNDKEDDQFADEKAFLIKQIQQLPNA